MDPDPYPGSTFLLTPAGLALSVVLLTVASAMLSGYELALYLRREEDEKKLRPLERSFLHQTTERPAQLFMTVLLGLALLDGLLAGTSLQLATTQLLLAGLRPWLAWALAALGTLLILLLLAEVGPRYMAARWPGRFLAISSYLFTAVYYLLWPLTWLLARLVAAAQWQFTQENKALAAAEAVPKQEVADLVPTPDVFESVVGLSSIPVKAVMRPRVALQALKASTPTEDLLAEVEKMGYSRIPIYEGSLDKILGILYVKDLLPMLQAQQETDWHALIRPAYFIPQTMRLHHLLNEFKEKHLHIAVVIDEHGGTAGIVTLQDILEEIFGEFQTEASPAMPGSKPTAAPPE